MCRYKVKFTYINEHSGQIVHCSYSLQTAIMKHPRLTFTFHDICQPQVWVPDDDIRRTCELAQFRKSIVSENQNLLNTYFPVHLM